MDASAVTDDYAESFMCSIIQRCRAIIGSRGGHGDSMTDLGVLLFASVRASEWIGADARAGGGDCSPIPIVKGDCYDSTRPYVIMSQEQFESIAVPYTASLMAAILPFTILILYFAIL